MILKICYKIAKWANSPLFVFLRDIFVKGFFLGDKRSEKNRANNRKSY